ncbi:MAG: thiamine-phosphate kinase [Bacteroidetes bacterium]|nr:thiamine-phosphate kinase [Bacteroidota bacterium]
MKKNNEIKTPTKLADLGEFGVIDKITKGFINSNNSSVLGIGDDAAVLDFKDNQALISTDMMVEGVHFDLAYMPLKHLGYKAVVSNLSDIYSMNGTCTQITVSIAVSNRFNLESLEELYLGIRAACKTYKIDLVGGDTTTSTKGLIISITSIGSAKSKDIVKRSGAQINDLIVVSGDLGSAYMGLQVLERENEVFKVNPQNQPDLSDYAYLLKRQLKPEARKDVIDFFADKKITPTSMIDISDGLSSEVLHICKQSNVGCDLYEEKIPLSKEMKSGCEEFKLHSTTIALSGGEDYELLFTINQKDYDKIKGNNDLTVIGHIIDSEKGINLVTKSEDKVPITSQGWKSF